MVAVAAGRFDGFFELKFGGCWDVAAGAVIVREAGGEVVDPSGREFGKKEYINIYIYIYLGVGRELRQKRGLVMNVSD